MQADRLLARVSQGWPRLREAMPDRRDPDRIRHAMFEMVMSRVLAIACGHEDAIDLDRLRHDPLMKLAVGRCPESGQPLASQSTISRLENAPSKTEAARLAAALLDQFGTTVKPGNLEILDIDDTFCAAHGTQQFAFWNAHPPPTADRGAFSAREGVRRTLGYGARRQRWAIPARPNPGGRAAGDGLGCLAPGAPSESVTPSATPAGVSRHNYQ
jgi:Transposase DDE domain group 1